jgi:ribosomal protein S18 acetylase RimI-like enzyme
MERFEQELRERGIASYGLDVMAGNDAALAFYATLGLQVAQTTLYKVLPTAD